MESILGFISTILGAGGLLGFISYILFFRANKRIKNAEATEKEIANLQAAYELMKEQIAFQGEQITKLRVQIGERDMTIQQLYRDKSLHEIKYSQKKSAINKAHSCEHSALCPVLNKLQELEEAYYRKINDKQQNISNNESN